MKHFVPRGMEMFPLASPACEARAIRMGSLPPSDRQSVKPDRCEVGNFLFKTVR